MKRLAILGASGHGKVVADAAESAGWSEVVFFDDAWPELQKNGLWRVCGDTRELIRSFLNFDGVSVAIGSNRIRVQKCAELADHGAKLATIIHPSAEVSRYAKLGGGSVVFAGAVVNVDVVTGQAAIINTGATIDHDCCLGDGVHISPGANLAGGVTVGNLSWLGIGASVKQMIKIGDRVVVGAGAAVINDISDDLIVAGVPAVPIDRK
ncbi:MAG: acetyltransferase [Gammaproteobacteria bacterium HGW-Gammaproteobacteria-10]|nr:MAG: acetyltransferase [Gammaproteobacteria bacterium HGW-Gammaproteobacteria-10]